MNLDDLDKKLWKELKKNAGIKSSKWFQKADASVGKCVQAAQKAKQKFESDQLIEDLIAYQKALKTLAVAFDKFVDSKGLNEVKEDDLKASAKKALASDIESWKSDIEKAESDLDTKLKKLVKAVDGDHKKIDSLEAGKKRAVWKSIGIDDTFNL